MTPVCLWATPRPRNLGRNLGEIWRLTKIPIPFPGVREVFLWLHSLGCLHQQNPFVNCDSSTGSKIHNLLGQENILIFTKPPTNLFLWRKCFDLTWVYGNVAWALAWQSKNSSSRPGWVILTTLFLLGDLSSLLLRPALHTPKDGVLYT